MSNNKIQTITFSILPFSSYSFYTTILIIVSAKASTSFSESLRLMTATSLPIRMIVLTIISTFSPIFMKIIKFTVFPTTSFSIKSISIFWTMIKFKKSTIIDQFTTITFNILSSSSLFFMIWSTLEIVPRKSL